MAKKKTRPRNTTVYCATEGRAEAAFLEHLKSIYVSPDDKIVFPDNPKKGGNGDTIVNHALRSCSYDRSFAWIDEDVDLSEETRAALAKSWDADVKGVKACKLKDIQGTYNPDNKKPTLIVSSPVCFESFVLLVLGKKIPYKTFDPLQREKQIQNLKNAKSGVFGKMTDVDYYKAHLDRSVLEERRKQITELDMLIKIITK